MIQQAIGPHEDLLTIVKRRELQWYGCFPFIRSGQSRLARHSERGKKTRQTEEEVGRQHQGMDRPGVRQVPEGSGEQGKTEKTGCGIICCAPSTFAVMRQMMMMMSDGVLGNTPTVIECCQENRQLPLILQLFSCQEMIVGQWQVQHAAIWHWYLLLCIYIICFNFFIVSVHFWVFLLLFFSSGNNISDKSS